MRWNEIHFLIILWEVDNARLHNFFFLLQLPFHRCANFCFVHICTAKEYQVVKDKGERMAILLIRLRSRAKVVFLKLMKWKIKFIGLKKNFSFCRFYFYSPFAKLFAKIWKSRNPKSCLMFAEMFCVCFTQIRKILFWDRANMLQRRFDVFTHSREKQQVKMCQCQITTLSSASYLSRQFTVEHTLEKLEMTPHFEHTSEKANKNRFKLSPFLLPHCRVVYRV